MRLFSRLHTPNAMEKKPRYPTKKQSSPFTILDLFIMKESIYQRQSTPSSKSLQLFIKSPCRLQPQGKAKRKPKTSPAQSSPLPRATRERKRGRKKKARKPADDQGTAPVRPTHASGAWAPPRNTPRNILIYNARWNEE
jgi:hypothetical protein